MRDRGSARATSASHRNCVAAGRSAGIRIPTTATTNPAASAAKSWEKNREKAQNHKTGPAASTTNVDKKHSGEWKTKRARPKLTS